MKNHWAFNAFCAAAIAVPTVAAAPQGFKLVMNSTEALNVRGREFLLKEGFTNVSEEATVHRDSSCPKRRAYHTDQVDDVHICFELAQKSGVYYPVRVLGRN